MAVVVQCYHCNTILELDDGFRGGVCRCSTCGSLLQVPKAATTTTTAPKARPAAPGAKPADSSPASDSSADTGLSSGQFDPRQAPAKTPRRPAVPDFGGSSSGLRAGAAKGRPHAPTTSSQSTRKTEKFIPVGPSRPVAHSKKQPRKNNTLLYLAIILIAAVAAIVIVVGTLLILQPQEPATQPKKALTTPKAAPTGPTATPPTPAATSPAVVAPQQHPIKGFLDMPLSGKKIVLSIDGASSMMDSFEYVRNGVYKAFDKLGPDQLMRIAIWKQGKLLKFPAKGFIDKSDLKLLKQELDVIPCGGVSDPVESMTATLAMGADQIIFVTAKPELPPQLVNSVLFEKSGKIRIDSILIGGTFTPSPLQDLSKQTGGTFRFSFPSQIKEMGH